MASKPKGAAKPAAPARSKPAAKPAPAPEHVHHFIDQVSGDGPTREAYAVCTLPGCHKRIKLTWRP